MKINEYNGAMKWIGCKKPTNKERADVLQWIDHNNGMYGTEEQHKEYKNKYATVANKYDESEDPRYVPPAEMEDIKKSLPVSEMVKKEERFNDKILKRDKYETPKKQIIKVVKKELPKDWKPKYLNGNVIDITPLLDDDWWDIFGEEAPEEESRLLLVPKSKAEGITSILNLHKKFVGQYSTSSFRGGGYYIFSLSKAS